MDNITNFTFTYLNFPTHVPITNNKNAPNKYIKINGQSIYNGNLQHYQRAIAVNWLHDYLLNNQQDFLQDIRRNHSIDYPKRLESFLYVPLNYGTVRRIKGIIHWTPAKDDYDPNWDIDNQWIWNKLFCDVLQLVKIIPNDNVRYISSSCITFVETKNFDDRKLVFRLFSNI